MQEGAWVKEFPAAITVCDAGGVILEMNDRACETFAREGGRGLVGKSALDCHPEPARSKLQRNLDQEVTNCYSIEKNGVKKLICQMPWYEDGQYMGLVELAIVLPKEIPHYNR
jgi:PAS domain-containing protein